MYRGGNMYLYYRSRVSASINVLSIDPCLFSEGVDITSGLSIYSSYALKYHVDVSIYNVVSTRNIAKTTNFLFVFFVVILGLSGLIKPPAPWQTIYYYQT